MYKMATAGEIHEDGFCLKEEIEMLEAIYINELTMKGPNERPSHISVLLHPSTGDEDDKQYVCMTLEIALSDKYPRELPSINIRNPRGLSDAHIESISENLHELMESLLGSPMLFQTIDYAKESLTDNNIPSCACAICLEHFQDHHSFTKTDCYHYFHCHCLLRYIEYHLNKIDESTEDKEKQIVCPMCRLPITYNTETLQAAPDINPIEEKVIYQADAKMKELQENMAKLFNKQLEKGGIINVEEEKNRYLISLTEVSESDSLNSSSTVQDAITDQPLNTQSNTNTTTTQTLPENNPTSKETKPQRDRPHSSRKYRGRGEFRPRNEGRRTEDKWNKQTKTSHNKSKEYSKSSREDRDRRNIDNRAQRNIDNFSRRRFDGNERSKVRENQSAGQSSEKGVRPRPERGLLSASTENSTISKPEQNPRDSDTVTSRKESEKQTKLATNQDNDISKRNTEDMSKSANNNATESLKSGADSNCDVTKISRDVAKNGATSQEREKVVRGPFQPRDRRPRNTRGTYRPYYKDSNDSNTDEKRKSSPIENKKTQKFSQPDKNKERVKSKQDSGVSRPPPGFDNVVKDSGGSRPPPGFEKKQPSLPKPPGF